MRTTISLRVLWIFAIAVFSPVLARCAPGPFGVLSPGGNTSPGPLISSNQLVFRWRASAGAASYELYLRDVTDSPSGPLYTYPVTGTNFTLTLYPGSSYKWN